MSAGLWQPLVLGKGNGPVRGEKSREGRNNFQQKEEEREEEADRVKALLPVVPPSLAFFLEPSTSLRQLNNGWKRPGVVGAWLFGQSFTAHQSGYLYRATEWFIHSLWLLLLLLLSQTVAILYLLDYIEHKYWVVVVAVISILVGCSGVLHLNANVCVQILKTFQYWYVVAQMTLAYFALGDILLWDHRAVMMGFQFPLLGLVLLVDAMPIHSRGSPDSSSSFSSSSSVSSPNYRNTGQPSMTQSNAGAEAVKTHSSDRQETATIPKKRGWDSHRFILAYVLLYFGFQILALYFEWLPNCTVRSFSYPIEWNTEQIYVSRSLTYMVFLTKYWVFSILHPQRLVMLNVPIRKVWENDVYNGSLAPYGAQE